MEGITLDSANFLNYRNTPWDSKVFGYSTNEILEIKWSNEETLNTMLNSFEDICSNNGVMFTNFRVHPNHFQVRKALSELGYINVETSLKVERRMNNFKPENYKIGRLKFELIKYSGEFKRDLQAVSFEIFNHGRFFEDPNISKEHANIRNRNWVNDLIKGSKIYLGLINSHVVGFMSFNIINERATLQLGGVKHPIYAYPFWLRVFSEIIDKYNASHVSGMVSASNLRILNLYSFFDFKFSETYLGYHIHRKKA